MSNFIQQQTEVAETFIAPLKERKDIKGIVFMGSLARGFADSYSDIDIAIFTDDKTKEIQLGEKWVSGWDVDLFNIAMNQGFADWSEIKREAYKESKLVYDVDGSVKEFLSRALEYGKEYRMNKIIDILFKLGWHGFGYSHIQGKKWRGYNWALPSDLWLKRNNIDNAFYILRYCCDISMDLIYTINSSWIPDFKWKYVKFQNLEWIPSNWNNDYNSIMRSNDGDLDVWDMKRNALQCIVDSCYEKIMDELPEDMYKYFIEKLDEY